MRQVTQNYRSGRIRTEQLNAPTCRRNGVVVRTAFSVISIGTEGMKVKEAKLSLAGKAMARPDQVKKVLKTLRQQGARATFEKVMSRLDSLTPLGYSSSGVVLEAGPEAREFYVGQRVACAGAEYAHHAEAVSVPRNLVVPVPDDVSMEHAAFATVGAIAMQGFRQSEMHLGEVACVVGLGLLGQLLTGILRAAGIAVVGVELAQDRCDAAVAVGAAVATTPDDPGLRGAVRALTAGFGVDCVFITAGGKSNAPLELAVELARDRARIVDVGKTKLDLPWNDCYMKELDLRFSRSYGPGRYDPSYEENGRDYPISYVRWTEKRNMAAFLDLVARRQVDLAPLVTAIRPVEEAETVYEELAEGGAPPLGILFRYPEAIDLVRRRPAAAAPRTAAAKLRLGVVGAGNYASTMLLPHFARESRVALAEVATRSPLSAANAQRRFPFERSSTDPKGLLAASDVNAVLVATRHASHAELTAAALEAGHPVFVEKPLSVDRAGVERVREAVVRTGNDRLHVGFNRRFSPLLRRLKAFFSPRAFPLAMTYRVHAGQLEAGSWYLDPGEGTRFLGEGGHFLDVLAYLTGSRPVEVTAYCQNREAPSADDRDNLTATVVYADGSVGTVQYLTQGGSQVPKEQLEVFGGGKAAQLVNFGRLELYAGDRHETVKAAVDKGQRAQVEAFVEAVCGGREMPIGLECLLETTLATLAVDEGLRRAGPVRLSEFWEPAAGLSASAGSDGAASRP